MNRYSYQSPSAGFTLIELLTVISIIGLLSSVVLAAVTSARDRGKLAAGQTFDRNTYAALYDSLVAEWNFDSDSGATAVDKSGNNNDLGLVNGSTIVTTPNPYGGGKAMSDTLGGTAAQTSGSLNNIPNGDFSVSLWIYISATDQFDILSNTFGLSLGKWKLGIQDGGRLTFIFRDAAINQKVQGETINPARWYNIMGTCSTVSGTPKIGIYVNGSLSASTVVSGCSFASGAVISPSIGTAGPNTAYLDNIRIYKMGMNI